MGWNFEKLFKLFGRWNRLARNKQEGPATKDD